MTAEEFQDNSSIFPSYSNGWESYYTSDEIRQLMVEFAKYQAIAFHNWMRKNDTPENAEKFFHYTDEDMLNVFKEETGW